MGKSLICPGCKWADPPTVKPAHNSDAGEGEKCGKLVEKKEWDSGDTFRWEEPCQLAVGHPGKCNTAAPPPAPGPEGVVERLINVTVRETDDPDWDDIECRFSNGEKYAAIQVDKDKPWLAFHVVDALTLFQSQKEEIERLLTDRRDILNVKTTDGMTASEWVLRTGIVEREVEALLEGMREIEGAPKDHVSDRVRRIATHHLEGREK